MKQLERQLGLEQEGVSRGVKKYREQVLKSSIVDLKPGLALLQDRMEAMVNAINSFLTPTGQKGGRLHSAKKFIRLLDLPAEELAYLTIRFCLNVSGEKSSLIQRCSIRLTETILDHHEYKKFKQLNPGYLKMLEDNATSRNLEHKRKVVMLKKRQWGITDTVMSDNDKMLVGLQLIDMCSKTTGFVQKVAIRKESQNNRKEVAYNLVLTEKTVKWLERENAKLEVLMPQHLPMIMPPRPWTDPMTGGYYSDAITHRNKVIKSHNPASFQDLAEADLSRVYSALNAIQATPWQINSFILDTIKALWASNSDLGGLTKAELREMPKKPWTTKEEYNALKENQPEVIKRWKGEARDTYAQQITDRGQRIALKARIDLADEFKEEPSIYFPHCLDWRGRVYPLTNWINPQADDVGKSLIRFANGKPLGKRGAFWLAVHGTGCYGYDKASFEDRYQWVKDHEDLIVDSAKNPLDGERFWAATDENGNPKADSPFCFLAFCQEWAQYLEQGESFVSHIPVALDATCSGLQMFSGLLRDEVGGACVNLVPADVPQDIYGRVAAVVSGLVQKDADEGDEMARLWVGKIDRGITKRPTMTKPYGAKKRGYKGQLMSELKKRGGEYLGTKDAFHPAVYLAGRMDDGINEIVIAARDAMAFLQEVARVCAPTNKALVWTTPVGFRARQDYRKTDTVRIDTFWGGCRMRLGLQKELPKLNSAKMGNSISPNLIHSFDSSMLMMTVNSCVEQGVTNFAMIHDSYGTHACDIDVLNVELRMAFVDMFSENLLEKFLDEVKQQIPEELHSKLPPLPPNGNLDLNDVLRSRYFFK